MKIELKPLDQITPYARNPRKNAAAVATVKASLKEYGWQQPIVVDPEGVIIAGHTRYLAALELGWKDAPVHVAHDLTPAQVKAYRLMDNKSHERAEWDLDLLALEMEDLKGLEFDLTLTGFGMEDLAGMVDAIETVHEGGILLNDRNNNNGEEQQKGYALGDKTLKGKGLLNAENLGFDLVVRLKDNLPMEEIKFWGNQLAKLVPKTLAIDAVIPAPSSGKRPIEQHLSTIMAQHVADYLKVPLKLLISNNNQRKNKGCREVKLKELKENKFTYSGERNKSYVIVDDVLFTRSTMLRCFAAVHEANCTAYAVVLYRA